MCTNHENSEPRQHARGGYRPRDRGWLADVGFKLGALKNAVTLEGAVSRGHSAYWQADRCSRRARSLCWISLFWFGSVSTALGQEADSMRVVGRQLVDRCGEQVILRGVNKMSVWTDRMGRDFSEIRLSGANSVRIVWTVADHGSDSDLARVLQAAVDNHLIPIIELHDATGELEKVPELVDFWVRPEIVAILRQHEQTLLLNIANEAGGSGVRSSEFSEVYATAISRLRAAGYIMPLIIDAPQWGQDIDVLQEAGPGLIEADPLKNLLFSVHTWWPSGAGSSDPGSASRIQSELQESVDMNLPLMIGEFAYYGVECAEFIDHRTLLAQAQAHQIGWLAWSWGPGNSDCEKMDMTTDGKFSTLHDWGLEVATTDPNSIANTSVVPRSILSGSCDPSAPLPGEGAPPTDGAAGAAGIVAPGPTSVTTTGTPAAASTPAMPTSDAAPTSDGGCGMAGPVNSKHAPGFAGLLLAGLASLFSRRGVRQRAAAKGRVAESAH